MASRKKAADADAIETKADAGDTDADEQSDAIEAAGYGEQTTREEHQRSGYTLPDHFYEVPEQLKVEKGELARATKKGTGAAENKSAAARKRSE